MATEYKFGEGSTPVADDPVNDYPPPHLRNLPGVGKTRGAPDPEAKDPAPPPEPVAFTGAEASEPAPAPAPAHSVFKRKGE